jgi:hypothetical protein
MRPSQQKIGLYRLLKKRGSDFKCAHSCTRVSKNVEVNICPKSNACWNTDDSLFYLYSRYSMWFPLMLTQLSALLFIRSAYSSKNSWFYSDLSTVILYSTASKSLIVSELINSFRSPHSQKSGRWKSGDRAGHDDWASTSYPLSPRSPVQVLSDSARTHKDFGVFRPDQWRRSITATIRDDLLDDSTKTRNFGNIRTSYEKKSWNLF